MVEKIRQILNKDTTGLHQAAFLLGGFAFVSQVLALARDKLLAASFGAGSELDVYYAAFRVPDFIFVTVGSMVSLSVLIPFLVRSGEGDERVRQLSNSIATAFLMAVSLSIALAFIAMPAITSRLFPGFSTSELETTVRFSRVLLLSPLILGFSNMLGALSQSTGRFFAYAASPVAYNAGIIAGIVLLMPRFGIVGAVLGVVLGALLHALIQVPSARATGAFPRLVWPDRDTVREIGRLAVPRTLALSMSHISVIFLLTIASGMAAGSIAVFTFAYNLQSVPLSIFGVSYSMAAFPLFSRLMSEGKREEFSDRLAHSARYIIFWTIPCAALLVVLRAHIVRVILGAGEFGWSDTRLTAALLAIFSVSLVFQSLSLLFMRALYAGGATGKPFSVSIFSAAVTVFVALGFATVFSSEPGILEWFARLFKLDGVAGAEALALPLGFAVGAVADSVLLWILLARQGHRFTRSVLFGAIRTTGASLAAAFSAYGILRVTAPVTNLSTFWGVLTQGVLAGVIGLLVFVAVARVGRLSELDEVMSTLTRKLGILSKPPVSPDTELT